MFSASFVQFCTICFARETKKIVLLVVKYSYDWPVLSSV